MRRPDRVEWVMRLGSRVASAAAAATILFCFAGAGAAPSLRAVERERARTEEARRRTAQEAAATAAAISRLQQALTERASDRVALETEIGRAERELASLVRLEAAADQDAGQNRAAFQNALIALSRAEVGAGSEALRAGRLAGVAASESAERLYAAERSAADLRRDRRALAQARATLAVDRARLDSARAAISAQSDELSARFAAQSAQQNELRRRSSELALQARDLRALIARSRPARRSESGAPRAAFSPVRGGVVRAFGEHAANGPAQGISIAARPSAQVVAPTGATVSFAGPFRDYGRVLILEARGGYAVVLAGLGRLDVEPGQTVTAGQPLGEMSADALPAPVLYVELRKNERPINPMHWLPAG